MPKIPHNFDGGKFAAHYGISTYDFTVMSESGELVCESLPKLTDEDLSLFVVVDKPQKSEEIFDLPIRAPSITVGDLFVESRNIKDDPDEAMDEAMAEADKGKGKAKSLDLIARSSLRMIDKLRRQVAVLEKRLDKLDKAK